MNYWVKGKIVMQKNPSQSKDTKVFISYAWGGGSERIAQDVEKALTKKGLEVVRDKSGGLNYKEPIREFMQEIGKGNFVIVIMSDKYLRSENCMFEMIQIAKNGDFLQRIYPIILKDAKIYKSRERVKYLKHWEIEIKELNNALSELEDQADAAEIHQDLTFFKNIRKEISGLTSKLKNMNTLTPEMHLNSNFEQIYEKIDTELKAINEHDKQKEKIPEKLFDKKLEIEFSSKIRNETLPFFTNREAEKKEFSDFLKIPKYKFCTIVGLGGIGKDEFLNNVGVTSRKYIEYDGFKDSNSSLFDLLVVLLSKFNIKYQAENLSSFVTAEIYVEKLLKKFDSETGMFLIFKDIHKIFNLATKKYYNKDFSDFFKFLIRKKQNEQNKILFTSEYNFITLEDRKLKRFGKNIEITTLNVNHIKEILVQEFLDRDKKNFAASIKGNQIKDDELQFMINGHPQIAKIFVEVSSIIGIQKVISEINSDKSLFIKKKQAYFIKKLLYNLGRNEAKYLDYFSLYEGKFDIDFIEYLSDRIFKSTNSEPSKIISLLSSQLFLKIFDTERLTNQYEISTLIKEEIKRLQSTQTREQINNSIANYFWKKATNTENKMSSIALNEAFQYFIKANNHEKINQLSLSFKGKLIGQFNGFAKNNNIEHALSIISILIKNNSITFSNNEFLSLSEVLYKGNKFRNRNEYKELQKLLEGRFNSSTYFKTDINIPKIVTYLLLARHKTLDAYHYLESCISEYFELNQISYQTELTLFFLDIVNYRKSYMNLLKYLKQIQKKHFDVYKKIYSALISRLPEEKAQRITRKFQLLTNRNFNYGGFDHNKKSFESRQNNIVPAKTFGLLKGLKPPKNFQYEYISNIRSYDDINEDFRKARIKMEQTNEIFEKSTLLDTNLGLIYRQCNFLLSLYDFEMVVKILKEEKILK